MFRLLALSQDFITPLVFHSVEDTQDVSKQKNTLSFNFEYSSNVGLSSSVMQMDRYYAVSISMSDSASSGFSREEMRRARIASIRLGLVSMTVLCQSILSSVILSITERIAIGLQPPTSDVEKKGELIPQEMYYQDNRQS